MIPFDPTGRSARTLGATDVAVGPFGLGGAPLGNLFRAVDRDEAERCMEAAWDAGLRFFDTAPLYGHGLSERRMGDVLRGKPRDSFVLCTKAGRLLRPVSRVEQDFGFADPLSFAVDYDYSGDGLRRSLEFSLARLGMNRIDVLLVHDLEPGTHGVAYAGHLRAFLDTGATALEELKSAGVVGAVGLGVNDVAAALDILPRAPLDAVLIAGRVTLLNRTAEAELLPLCARLNVSVIAGGVFNSGILVTGPAPGATYDYRPAPDDVLARAGRLAQIAADAGVPLGAAALQFPLRCERVAVVLIGAAATDMLRANLDFARTPVSDDAWARFEAERA